LPDRIGYVYHPSTTSNQAWKERGMGYILVQPPYGPIVAHRAECYTLKSRSAGDEHEAVPPGAVICVHCHRVPPDARDPSPDEAEEGFILIFDPHRPGRGRIVHHPQCRTLTTKMIGGSRWNHRKIAQIPEDAKVCSLCRCLPPKPRVRYSTGPIRVSQAKPSGEYFVGKGQILVPKRCPSCGGEAIDREPGTRLWFCYSCPWMGQVKASTWTLVSSVKAKPALGGSGGSRAVPRYIRGNKGRPSD
jgi:hypothetical protein